MARYYGTIQGARGPTSRLGHASSGLRVTAQSFQGDVVVEFSTDGSGLHEGDDVVNIYVRPHSGSSGNTVGLYYGPIKKLLEVEGQDALIRLFAERKLKERAVGEA